MPELPEVENVRATLAELVIGKKIDRVSVGVPKMIVGMPAEAFIDNMIDQQIEAVRRRGKFLLIDTTDGTLLSHLRMEGKYRLNNASDPVDKHTHVIFHFTDDTELRYLDVRKFGTMELVPKHQEDTTKSIQKLGPEPLSAKFEKKAFGTKLQKSGRAVKTVLLDQSLVAGIGNIYADEICFQAKVLPERPANTLKPAEITRLYESTKAIMTEAVALGGSTIRTYVNSQGKIGGYQEKLQVYGEKGNPCPRCGTPIVKIKLNGRGTHFCPKCQK
ncbi:DNA-formamidopyrimidine glycosylase [Listeria booriae]|uniref:Formamidopyrimidine-DNA glycosylase n=1 Tax=Listeria booriae TaxID=1552123 RepID=A0A7X0YLR7_9LIST|nr:DNA-formamidopyrimidine glycosylase [Listeria booriae]MBC2116552.1 DNA-formamidopyrimidine glycosylase [Listeria booriae]